MGNSITLETDLRITMLEFGVPEKRVDMCIYELTEPDRIVISRERLNYPVSHIDNDRYTEHVTDALMKLVLSAKRDQIYEPWVLRVEYHLSRAGTILIVGSFSGMSYSELTNSVKYRTNQLREYNKFLESVPDIPQQVRWDIRYKRISLSREIQRLMNLRRDMKRDSRTVSFLLKNMLK